MIQYSVVIPVYNSEQTLQDLCSRVSTSLSPLGTFEMILVDDGSVDGSWKQLLVLKQQYKDSLKIIRLSKNFGQHNALTCGFGFAEGNYIITMDDDLQHPPEEIPKLIHKKTETNAELIYGIPRDRQHSRFRIAGSYFVKKSSNYVQGNSEGSSFRLMNKELVTHVINHQNRSMIYIDEIASWYTANIATVEVEHHARKSGKSGYSTARLVRLYLDILVNHSAVPLKLMTWIGLGGSLISFMMGVIFIMRKFIHNVPIGFTAIIVAVLFSASILMMCMGIIGQYLYKLFLLQNRKPQFAIREIK